MFVSKSSVMCSGYFLKAHGGFNSGVSQEAASSITIANTAWDNRVLISQLMLKSAGKDD